MKVVVLLAILFFGIFIGWQLKTNSIDRYYTSYSGDLTRQEVIDLLASYRATHQFYVDHPEKIGNMTGSVKDNQRLIENYSKIIQWVEGK